MIDKIKAIETVYKGYRFKSRLEARWAVFFDSLNIKWEYEIEGYTFEDGYCYLPDFWFPEVGMWGEVKAIDFNIDEINKAINLAKYSKFPLLMLIGIPENKPYEAINIDGYISDQYVLSNYHNYPKDEGRFYSNPGEDIEDFDEYFDDTKYAVNKARAARFEFKKDGSGETEVIFIERDLGPVKGWAQTVSITKLAKKYNLEYCPKCMHEFKLQESHGLYYCKYCGEGGGLKKFAELIASKLNQ